MEKPFPDVSVAETSNLRQTVNVSVPQPHRSVKQSWNTKKIRFNFNTPSEHLIWFVSAGRWVFHFRLNFLRSVENSTWTPVLLCSRWMRRTTFNQTCQTDFFGWLWRRNDGFSLTLKQRSRWHKMNCGWCCEFILWLFTRGRWKCRWRQITCFSWILFQEFCFFSCGDFL